MFEAVYEMGKRAAEMDESKMIAEIFEDETLQAQIVDLNQNQLYEQGLQADGTPTGEYAPITISFYKPLAAAEGRDGRSDHITGKDTGETYKSMKVANEDKAIRIEAEDRNDFFKRIPEGLGLTGESINQIIPEVRETLIEKVRDKIGI